MRDGARTAILAAVLLAIVAAAITAPMLRSPAPNTAVFAVAVLAVVAGIAAVTWARLRPERLPDHLRAVCRPVYEAGGLTIGVALESEQDRTYFVVYFQNRFARACVADVGLTRDALSVTGRTPRANAAMRFQCPGGAFGVARVPFPVPDGMAERRRRFVLSAATQYPGGRGQLLRFRSGRAMTAGHGAGGAGMLLTVLLGIGPALLLSLLTERGPATRRVRLRVPARADEPATECPSPPTPIEILWSLDDLEADAPASGPHDEDEPIAPPLEPGFGAPVAPSPALEVPEVVLTNA